MVKFLSITSLIILLLIIAVLYFVIKNLKIFLIIAILLIAFYIFYQYGTSISTGNIELIINNITQSVTGHQLIENISSTNVIDNIPNETVSGLFYMMNSF